MNTRCRYRQRGVPNLSGNIMPIWVLKNAKWEIGYRTGLKRVYQDGGNARASRHPMPQAEPAPAERPDGNKKPAAHQWYRRF
jgi:hypothetical protein